MRALVLFPVLLAACDPEIAEVTEPDDVAEENPYGVARSCPAFTTGTVTLEAGGLVRELQVELPSDPEGAPVVFAWHWLGGTGTQILDWMRIRELADGGAIVIAPESSGLPFEWELEDTSDANPDFALFDATLACLWEEHRVDADRVYATGMSAGGLMTTLLTLHRADALAATAPFSGGASEAHYRSPESDVPVLVTWGGPSDSYGGYDFHAASVAFAELLEADGHLAVRCEHDLGHLPPVEAPEMAGLFFEEHVRGEPSPWEEALPGTLPEWCE